MFSSDNRTGVDKLEQDIKDLERPVLLKGKEKLFLFLLGLL